MPPRSILILLALVLPMLAQDSGGHEQRPFIRVAGEASVSAKPDQADINIGVVSQASTAEEAGTQNAKQATAAIATIKDLLGQNANVKSVNYSLTPNQRFPPGGGTPTITGYTASNTVHVRTENLAVVGKLIDAVTKSGANNIQGIQFTIRDQQPLRTQALKEAALQARSTADAVAASLGLRVVRVLSVEVGQAPAIHPVAEPMVRMAAAATTPMEPGTVDVHANLVLTLEVTQ
jgi:uncharacterized protein YggE